MSVKENKGILSRFIEECWKNKDLNVIDELIAPDCPHHNNGPVNFSGPEGFKNAVNNWNTWFPGFQFATSSIIGEGDMVSSVGRFKGTHQGEINLPQLSIVVPPTGKTVEIEMVFNVRIADGKVAEGWTICDYSWIQRLVQG
jgi:predicted ester cyclase